MAGFKRIFLFLLINILIVTTLSLIMHILGVKPYLTKFGLDYSSLIIFCLIWGMGGAFISLALSKVMAKWMMGVQIIDPSNSQFELRELVQTVHQLAKSAGLPAMPEVGIYDSPEINAFATGPTKSSSLVAVSTGLLQRMNKNEIRGVLGHEMAHIANGDMVTMTLIQGIVNAFVMFLARVIAYAVTIGRGNNEEEESSAGSGTPFMFYIVQMVLEVIFMILGSIVVAWFSRLREYRADNGGARLAGKANMIASLEALNRVFEEVETDHQPAMQTLKISSRPAGIMRFFSTHPPLEDRIAKLKLEN
ncbi:MAG: protease HtpX [Oligoflexia bacterium]|nr:protease HtpX [Oligoflexia bacterium]